MMPGDIQFINEFPEQVQVQLWDPVSICKVRHDVLLMGVTEDANLR
jgi:hypothetical protein